MFQYTCCTLAIILWKGGGELKLCVRGFSWELLTYNTQSLTYLSIHFHSTVPCNSTYLSIYPIHSSIHHNHLSNHCFINSNPMKTIIITGVAQSPRDKQVPNPPYLSHLYDVKGNQICVYQDFPYRDRFTVKAVPTTEGPYDL